MSPRSCPSPARAASSSRRDSSSAQPESIRTSPAPSSIAYTLTARSPSLGSGSGIRCTPGATSNAPGRSQSWRDEDADGAAGCAPECPSGRGGLSGTGLPGSRAATAWQHTGPIRPDPGRPDPARSWPARSWPGCPGRASWLGPGWASWPGCPGRGRLARPLRAGPPTAGGGARLGRLGPALAALRLLIGLHDLHRHPASLLDREAMLGGPGPHLGAVLARRRGTRLRVARPVGPDRPRVLGEVAQLVPHLSGVVAIQVDFVILALISELDGDISLAAIEIVNQADDCFLHDQAPHTVSGPGIFSHAVARSYVPPWLPCSRGSVRPEALAYLPADSGVTAKRYRAAWCYAWARMSR